MLKILYLFIGIITFSCNSPMQNKSERYNDLTKGTAGCLSADEAEIIDAMIEGRNCGARIVPVI